jgi:hypothetical protein
MGVPGSPESLAQGMFPSTGCPSSLFVPRAASLWFGNGSQACQSEVLHRARFDHGALGELFPSPRASAVTQNRPTRKLGTLTPTEDSRHACLTLRASQTVRTFSSLVKRQSYKGSSDGHENSNLTPVDGIISHAAALSDLLGGQIHSLAKYLIDPPRR